MAMRLKTVEYTFPTLGAAADNIETSFEQITIYLPEKNKVFVSVVMDIFADDIITATGGTFVKRNMSLQLASNGYSANNNTQTFTNSGENITLFFSGDYTSYFQTYWAGDSLTCDATVTFDQNSGTTLGMRDITSKLTITYQYEETSPTQVKTVWLPLNAPSTHLDVAKPVIPNSYIPALDTWLPETDIDIKQITLVIQGNDETVATGDFPISMEIDGYGTRTTNDRVAALASCRFFRYFWDINVQPSVLFDTSLPHNFYIWTTVAARCAHLQCWMIITYEYNESTSDVILNSILLPMEIDSPFGGISVGLSQQAARILWIEEPGPISIKESALLLFYDSVSAVTGLSARIGTGTCAGAWVSIIDTSSQMCGGYGAMIRGEEYMTLSRGKNILKIDVFRTATTVGGFNASCLWMINYTSAKSDNGSGSHNHTVKKNIATTGTGAASVYRETANAYFSVPEEYYFYNAIGINYIYLTNTSGGAAGVTVQTQRKSTEGGPKWEVIYTDLGNTDVEVGIRQCFATARNTFKRFNGDTSLIGDRLDVSTARYYRAWLANSCTSWDHLDFIVTYHSITSTISGNITNYTGDGSNIPVHIFRIENNEYILSTTTSIGGSYSITWFDNAAELFSIAKQTGVYVGRSDNDYAILDTPPTLYQYYNFVNETFPNSSTSTGAAGTLLAGASSTFQADAASVDGIAINALGDEVWYDNNTTGTRILGGGYSAVFKVKSIELNPGILLRVTGGGTYFSCYSSPTPITGELDLSKMTSLTDILCYANQIDTLDISLLTSLVNLNCRNNIIEVLDVTHAPIAYLSCHTNEISILDISNLTSSLYYLACYGNHISSLDVASCPLLTDLVCSENTIPTLDVSSLNVLVYLQCRNNLMTQTAVNTIIDDLYANWQAHPRTGYLHIGGTNAAPSSAQITKLTTMATDVTYPWTVNYTAP